MAATLPLFVIMMVFGDVVDATSDGVNDTTF
jgi:hypothetical protein